VESGVKDEAIPKPNIVVAEDNIGDELLMRDALALHSFDVKLVMRTGDEVFRLIERIEEGQTPCPDLLLLDLNLPRRSGKEILARMRQSPSCGQMPIIVVTSSDAPRDREEVKILGANEYFVKTTSYDQFMVLGTVVKALLG
jgi:DNA-binding response OmpR family regulator